MKYTLFLLLLALHSSCHFYNSRVPITASDKSVIDAKIIGRWYVLEKDEENATLKRTEEYLRVLDFNGKEYAVLAESKEATMLFKVHSSIINKKTFLNIFPIEEPEKDVDRNYIFFIIDSLDSEKAALRYITDSIKVQFNNSKEFEKYLKKNFEKLTREAMSAPFYYYRAEYFLWDKLNTLKSSDIENVFEIDALFTETADKSATQLSIFPKKQSDKENAINILKNAYQSDEITDEFQPIYTQLLQFNDGKMKVFYFSKDRLSFRDAENEIVYKIKH
jgi:hypothetical protein